MCRRPKSNGARSPRPPPREPDLPSNSARQKRRPRMCRRPQSNCTVTVGTQGTEPDLPSNRAGRRRRPRMNRRPQSNCTLTVGTQGTEPDLPSNSAGRSRRPRVSRRSKSDAAPAPHVPQPLRLAVVTTASSCGRTTCSTGGRCRKRASTLLGSVGLREADGDQQIGHGHGLHGATEPDVFPHRGARAGPGCRAEGQAARVPFRQTVEQRQPT